MQRRHCDHYRLAVTTRIARLDITRRLEDYALGYADQQADYAAGPHDPGG